MVNVRSRPSEPMLGHRAVKTKIYAISLSVTWKLTKFLAVDSREIALMPEPPAVCYIYDLFIRTRRTQLRPNSV